MIINANKISIDFKDTDYAKGLGVSVQSAREGSVSHVGIEYTKDCTVQKEMENRIVYTGADGDKNDILEEVTKNLPAERFDPADFISKSMTGKDARDIEEEGSILEEYVASSLERAVERVKSQRHERAESVQRQVEKGEEEREYFDEMEDRIREAAQMASQVAGMSDASVRYFLENDLSFTPVDISNSSAVAATGTYKESRASFDAVEKQAEAILEKSGMEADEKNLETAKWLYENDVPVTGENIQAYQTLEELKDVPPEVLADRIEDAVMDGIVPEGADLTEISRKEAERRLEAFRQTDDSVLRKTFITEADFLKAKRQMEEIRLTMTIDAARAMENKGIHLDVQNLVEIVDELKKMEQEVCQKHLIENGVLADSENIGIAVETMRAGADILAAPVSVYGRTIASVDSDTIQDIASAGNDLRSQMEAASESYETVGTEVRRDLGDSITKAFSNVDDILRDLGFDTTAANERAVRILAYNRMPLTKENIISMKEYDDKVTTLAKGLTPKVVSELIRRQENPLEMNLEELGDKVARISEEVQQEDISFRRYLWKLDHSGEITEEERKSMIGIYRLLDKVEKSDGAVIGQVVKAGRELSFSSLLSAVRTRRAKGIDQTVDDEFGGLEEVLTAKESISDQIGAAFGSSVVKKLQKQLSPAVLREHNENYMEESLEVLLDECMNSEAAAGETEKYYEELAAQIREMAAESDEQIMTLLKEMDIPDRMINMHLMKTYLEQGGRSFLKFYSREESEALIDHLDNPEELTRTYEEFDEVHGEMLEAQKEEDGVHYENIRDIAVMAGSISFYRRMRQFQRYEVPIITERGVTSCSVTVCQGREAEKGTVEISLDSVRFGSVQATFKVSGKRVSGFMTSEAENAQEASGEIFHEFEKDLEMNGFTMERGDFAKGTRNSFHLGNKIEETATNDRLYLVAKLFIQNVQRREDER